MLDKTRFFFVKETKCSELQNKCLDLQKKVLKILGVRYLLVTTNKIVKVSLKNKVPVQVLWYFQASLPEADRHDTSSIYRKLTLAELQQEVPQINWLQYLKSFMDTDINQDELVVAYAMPYFIQMGKIIADTDRRFLSTN